MTNHISDLTRELSKYDFTNLTAADCARALRSTIDWLREASFYSRHQQRLSILRFQRLLRDLENDRASKEMMHALLAATLKYFDLSTLLTQTGLSRPHGFAQELISRGVDKILPRHSPRPNFMDLLYFLFPVETDAEFFQKIPREHYESLLTLFDPGLKDPLAGRKLLGEHFRTEVFEALFILSAECLVLSESALINDIRWTLGGAKRESYSFSELNSFLHKLVHYRRKHQVGKWDEGVKEKYEEEFSKILSECRAELSTIMAHLEQSSLSVDLVYQLEVLQLLLDRIRALLLIFIFDAHNGPKSMEFFATLIAEEQRRRSVRSLISQNLHYLARKIVDNAGDTGDHYIARNPLESRDLFVAAFGGGFLTGFTILFKIFIHHAHFVLFFEGFFAAINFAGSFILMQFLHLTLATKQPAMTAAALARRMTSLSSELTELRQEMKNLLRSQALAAMGNLCAVIPTAYCLFLVWESVFSTPILEPAAARAIIAAHNPLTSLTFFYAMLTGVILWSSSLVHGWMQNWMIFRGIPELLSDSFLLENFLSREKRLRLSKWLRNNLASITANIALGVFLAFTPIFGSFFGLPLDVRHITLATGSLTLAWASVPYSEITTGGLATSLIGMFIILLGNLLTSFFLSLWLALRAKGWYLADVKYVLRSLYRK